MEGKPAKATVKFFDVLNLNPIAQSSATTGQEGPSAREGSILKTQKTSASILNRSSRIKGNQNGGRDQKKKRVFIQEDDPDESSITKNQASEQFQGETVKTSQKPKVNVTSFIANAKETTNQQRGSQPALTKISSILSQNVEQSKDMLDEVQKRQIIIKRDSEDVGGQFEDFRFDNLANDLPPNPNHQQVLQGTNNLDKNSQSSQQQATRQNQQMNYKKQRIGNSESGHQQQSSPSPSANENQSITSGKNHKNSAIQLHKEPESNKNIENATVTSQGITSSIMKRQMNEEDRRFKESQQKLVRVLSLLANDNQVELAIEEAEIGFGKRKGPQTKDTNILQVNELFILAKCYILKGNVTIESKLDEISMSLDTLRKRDIKIEEIKRELLEIQNREFQQSELQQQQSIDGMGSGRKGQNKFVNQTSKDLKQFEFREFKWLLQSYGLLASFYNATGFETKCEKVYVVYVTLIEEFFGGQSLEASNAYFLVGLYYYEKSKGHKAIACFRKSLAIRQKMLSHMHQSCSDCLLNLGILYKQRADSVQAIHCLQQALEIRQENIGVDSLAAATVHEELGKLYLEIENYRDAYQYLKEAYNIRKKLYFNRRVEDVERVSTLLVFLHRKIEIQIQGYNEAKKDGSLKLLTDIGAQLQDTLTNTKAEEDSFNFLKRLDETLLSGNHIDESVSDSYQNGRQILEEKLQMRNLKDINDQRQAQFRQQETTPIIVSDSNTEHYYQNQAGKAFKNFAKKGQQERQKPLQVIHCDEYQNNPMQSSGTENDEDTFDKLVDAGVQNAFQIAENTIQDSLLPRLVSLLFSLTPNQLLTLQDKQLTCASEKDPLYFCKEFLESLDAVQQKLLQQSKAWLIPRNAFLRRNQTEQSPQKGVNQDHFDELDSQVAERNQVLKQYKFFQISLDHVVVPKNLDKAAGRRQLHKDQQIYKLIQREPKFIKSLLPCQSRLFQQVMINDLSLQFLFISLQNEQVGALSHLLQAVDLQRESLAELGQIMAEFFNNQTNQDQIESVVKSSDQQMTADEVARFLMRSHVSKKVEPEEVQMNVKYLRRQYFVEIMTIIDQMAHQRSNLAKLNPSLIGIDEVYLYRNLTTLKADQLKKELDNIEEILARSNAHLNTDQRAADQDLQDQERELEETTELLTMESFKNSVKELINGVETRLIYLYYRRLKNLYSQMHQARPLQNALDRHVQEFVGQHDDEDGEQNVEGAAFRVDPVTGERTFEVRPMDYALLHHNQNQHQTVSSEGTTRLHSHHNEDQLSGGGREEDFLAQQAAISARFLNLDPTTRASGTTVSAAAAAGAGYTRGEKQNSQHGGTSSHKATGLSSGNKKNKVHRGKHSNKPAILVETQGSLNSNAGLSGRSALENRSTAVARSSHRTTNTSLQYQQQLLHSQASLVSNSNQQSNTNTKTNQANYNNNNSSSNKQNQQSTTNSSVYSFGGERGVAGNKKQPIDSNVANKSGERGERGGGAVTKLLQATTKYQQRNSHNNSNSNSFNSKTVMMNTNAPQHLSLAARNYPSTERNENTTDHDDDDDSSDGSLHTEYSSDEEQEQEQEQDMRRRRSPEYRKNQTIPNQTATITLKTAGAGQQKGNQNRQQRNGFSKNSTTTTNQKAAARNQLQQYQNQQYR